jgi:hypothetical protein
VLLITLLPFKQLTAERQVGHSRDRMKVEAGSSKSNTAEIKCHAATR